VLLERRALLTRETFVSFGSGFIPKSRGHRGQRAALGPPGRFIARLFNFKFLFYELCPAGASLAGSWAHTESPASPDPAPPQGLLLGRAAAAAAEFGFSLAEGSIPRSRTAPRGFPGSSI